MSLTPLNRKLQFVNLPLFYDRSNGEQIALTRFRTYNHATVLTVRLPF